MFKPSKKQIYITLAVVVGLVVVYFGLLRVSPVRVETAKALVGDLKETIDAEGKTRFHDRYVVTAPVSGMMRRIAIHEGANVPKGYPITMIDPAPPKPADPTSQPEPAILPAAYTVFAPESGRLTRVYISSERIVEAGTPIVEISKPDKLELVIDVLSGDATQVRPLMPVIVQNWGGEGELRARVRTVEPQAFTKVSSLGVEEQRVDVIADFTNPPPRLGDNYRVDARIVLWEAEKVLQVPSNGLFRSGNKWSVYVVESGRARLREVKVGHRSPEAVEILKGVTEGDTVLLHPPNTVSDGTKVTW